MTDFQEYTMLQPKPLEEYVGFTEEEVSNLCLSSKLSFEDLRKWYDGYLLASNHHIYSPKSVMDAIRYEHIGNYWTQSETYEALKIYIEMNFDGLKEAVLQMIGGAKVRINISTYQNDMSSIKNRDDVLTLLTHLGYLCYYPEDKTVFIPNEEVLQVFIDAVENSKYTEIVSFIQQSGLLLH